MRLVWSRKGMMAAVVALAASLCVGVSGADAAPQVHLQVPAHDPGCRMLRQFLQDRGFSLTQRRRGKRLLVVQMQSQYKVRLVYLRYQRSYRLPKQLQAPRTRARAVMSMFDVFLEEARSQQRASAARKRRPARKARPPVRLVTRRPTRRRGPVPRVVTSAPLRPKVVAKGGALPLRVVKARPVVRRAPALSRPAPAPRRATKRRAMARPLPRKVARTGMIVRRVAPPSRSVFGVVSAAGSMRWAGRWESSWGGVLTGGLLLSDLALRVELSLLSFWIERQEDTILLIRPAIWAGWRTPLRRWTKRFELYILGGVILDPFVIERINDWRSIYHLGLAFGVEGHWRFSSRFSLFVKYTGAGFLIGYEPDEEGLDRKAYPAPWQQSVRVGVQARF